MVSKEPKMTLGWFYIQGYEQEHRINMMSGHVRCRKYSISSEIRKGRARYRVPVLMASLSRSWLPIKMMDDRCPNRWPVADRRSGYALLRWLDIYFIRAPASAALFLTAINCHPSLPKISSFFTPRRLSTSDRLITSGFISAVTCPLHSETDESKLKKASSGYYLLVGISPRGNACYLLSNSRYNRCMS